MPARISKRDTYPKEPPRKKRRVHADAEIAGNCSYPFLQKPSLTNFTAVKRLRRLEDVDVSTGGDRIPTTEFLDKWFASSDWSSVRQRKRLIKMPQLPSPDASGAAPAPKSTATALSRKSTASVQDTDYRETLEQYNIYIEEEEPPPGLIQEAKNIIFRSRESPELDDEAVKQLKKIVRDLRNKGEEEVRNKLGANLIPGYKTLSNPKLDVVHGQLWNKAVAIPLNLNVLQKPLPLPKPKPDTTIGYAKAAFTRSQLETIKLLIQEPQGSNFISPHQDIRLPFVVVEYKSQGKDGSIRVATNQAAGAGAVVLNGFLELMSRGPGLDAFDYNKPLFFSVTMDQNNAYINVQWIGKTSDTNQHTFNLDELTILPLRYGDSIRVLQRALKNIFDYGADECLRLILDALDEFRKSIIAQRNAESAEKTQAQAEPRAPPSPPQRAPPRKKAKGMAAAGKIGHAPSKAREETTA